MSFQRQISTGDLRGTGFRGGLAAGTDLRTPCGPRRVEILRPGDLVVTRSAGLQPVRMIWKRRVSAAQMRANPALAPIRLRARVIGPMMPQRDLLLAPDHRLVLPGHRIVGAVDSPPVLVEAHEIAGSRGRVAADPPGETVTFYQLVFDGHQVMAANGLPVESFLPTASALACLDPDLRETLLETYPQLGKGPGSYPAPAFRIETGIELAPAMF